MFSNVIPAFDVALFVTQPTNFVQFTSGGESLAGDSGVSRFALQEAALLNSAPFGQTLWNYGTEVLGRAKKNISMTFCASNIQLAAVSPSMQDVISAGAVSMTSSTTALTAMFLMRTCVEVVPPAKPAKGPSALSLQLRKAIDNDTAWNRTQEVFRAAMPIHIGGNQVKAYEMVDAQIADVMKVIAPAAQQNVGEMLRAYYREELTEMFGSSSKPTEHFSEGVVRTLGTLEQNQIRQGVPALSTDPINDMAPTPPESEGLTREQDAQIAMIMLRRGATIADKTSAAETLTESLTKYLNPESDAYKALMADLIALAKDGPTPTAQLARGVLAEVNKVRTDAEIAAMLEGWKFLADPNLTEKPFIIGRGTQIPGSNHWTPEQIAAASETEPLKFTTRSEMRAAKKDDEGNSEK